MGRYEGKKVVVTGGTSGIGLVTAKLLLDEGARVLITGRTKDGVESARRGLGESATLIESNSGALSDIASLAVRVKSQFETLDALLFCAGQTRFAPFEAVTEAMYDEVLTTNTKGAYFTAQKLSALMSDGGSIVFITSVANVLGIPILVELALHPHRIGEKQIARSRCCLLG